MTISLDLSTSLALTSDLPFQPLAAGDVRVSTAHWPDYETYARAAVDRLRAALLSWIGIGPLPAPELAMGVVVVASFGDLAAGRLAPALEPPALDLRDLPLLTSFSWPQVTVFGRFGWALDMPQRPRQLAIHADGLELELDAAERRALAAGIDFHVRHAGSHEEREAWWCAVGRPSPG